MHDVRPYARDQSGQLTRHHRVGEGRMVALARLRVEQRQTLDQPAQAIDGEPIDLFMER